ncbi:hypothetical protein DNTS_000674 [Danionella cerebrum]|uniref:B30.2/SPRY domain-containing protein n=1 Tax=Danionella cerebrum TaxID=2873325 RepID=A0A553QDU7_9TELE|nr:hypothetical protein DNTS_000674 [Danionella translucida]
MPSSTRILTPQVKTTGKKDKAGNAPVERQPVYDPNIPEPTHRDELMKYWINISFDDRTAHKLLWVTEGGAKVSRMTDEVCPCLDRPERFDYSPQLLCKQSLWASRWYWEVQFSGWVVVGVVYDSAGRRASEGPCGLGENEESWAMGWSGSSYEAWHKGTSIRVSNELGSGRMGVYVDQPAGVICFYTIQIDQETKQREVKLLHRYENPLKEKLLPGFWMGSKSSCIILKKEE